jgi:tRNA A22 N-methylase
MVMVQFNSTLYYKVEQLIPDTVAIYHVIVVQNTSAEDRYTALH